jgi:hypothetical protein
MSFFWSSSTEPKAQPKSSPRAIPVVTQSRHVDVIDVDVIDEQPTDVFDRKPRRSEPSAKAFDQVPVTRRASASTKLTVEIPKVKSTNGSVADECTPVHSAYNSPRVDVQFQVDPTDQFPATQFDVDECINRLEHAFYHDTKAYNNVLNQGIYKNTVVNGGHVCRTPSIQQRLRDLQAKHLQLLKETSELYDHLTQLL